MWLIDTETYRLKWFTDIKIPPYAILSHTWGDDELTFQDMQDPAVSEKPGFAKIRKTCRIAVGDGLRYAWVDTCCIDKKSSAELSEAINSMFNYYHDAKICYAFLSDLPSSWSKQSVTRRDTDDNVSEVPGLESCKWFRRGWTLQELIAPLHVNFYDRKWAFVSTRRTLKEQLFAITGIDTFVLDWTASAPGLISSNNATYASMYVLRGVLDQYNVAHRMSWAAKRDTTRIEDVAYGLLGIFDINMPMLYGEGNKAFARLQEEIIRRSTDHSMLVWSYGGSPPERAGGIFAAHPASFMNGAKVIPSPPQWHSRTLSAPRLTNEGLSITLPIVEGSEGRCWAVLDYSLSNDLIGPLALRLTREDLYSGPYYRILPNHGSVQERKRVNTIPLELAQTSAIMTNIVILSTKVGSLLVGNLLVRNARPGAERSRSPTPMSMRFRVSARQLQALGRQHARLLQTYPEGHEERIFVRDHSNRSADPFFGTPDSVVSLPLGVHGASAVRIGTSELMDDGTNPAICDIAFGPDTVPNKSGWNGWITIEPAVGSIGDLCLRSVAANTGVVSHRSRDMRVLGTFEINATISASKLDELVTVNSHYWKVDIYILRRVQPTDVGQIEPQELEGSLPCLPVHNLSAGTLTLRTREQQASDPETPHVPYAAPYDPLASERYNDVEIRSLHRTLYSQPGYDSEEH